MSWDPDDKHRHRGYHHGNLRETLIRAALELIAKNGPAGFTFADAARWAGVSSAAPYRHFRDRDALMADVARRGFEALAMALSKAWNDARPEPVAAFENVGKAYLRFAKDEPAYYSAMFESGLAPDASDALREAADRAFGVMRQAAEAVSDSMPREARPPAGMVGLHAWALAHGIASLFGRGDAARRTVPMAPEDLLEAGMLVYLRGLGYGDRKR